MISTTRMRNRRSWRKRPRPTSSPRSRFVAASRRTSTRRCPVAPIRSTIPSCRTRRSFTWAAGGSSPISSRNSVPPSASSKRPGLDSTAPVKAPRSWPNSSDSTRVSGRAPQLILTKGAPARGDIRCSASATSSLPVPVSPVIRTVDGEGARRWIRCRTASMPEDCRTRPHDAASEKGPRNSCRARSACPSPLATISRTLVLSNGLVRKSSAPCLIASTAASIVPCAVRRITGISGKPSFRRRRRARPSIPGILRSVMTRSGSWARTRSSASSALAARVVE